MAMGGFENSFVGGAPSSSDCPIDSKSLALLPRPLGRRISSEDGGVESLDSLERMTGLDRTSPRGLRKCVEFNGGGFDRVRLRVPKSVETRVKTPTDTALLRGVSGSWVFRPDNSRSESKNRT